MINLEVNLAGMNSNAGAAGSKGQLSSLSAQSFSALLSEAISETLSKFGIDPSSVKLTVDGGTSQSNGVRQNSDANRLDSADPFSAARVGTGAVSPSSVAGGGERPEVTAQPNAQSVSAGTATDDAYWAQQPLAVRQLRNMGYDQRMQVGTQLAEEGYTIDVPIMIWGWDPGKVTATREAAGFTWVPSALQQPVTAAPGITAPGLIPYDPNNPPQGSIRV